MNFILCVLTFLSVMIWSHPGAVVQETNKTPVGEVVEIGCKKSWRIDESGTKTLLHRKNDKGRKIFEGETYSCEGKGVLKLIVRSRPVDVTQETGPHPIGKNAGEDKKNTAGPPGDALAWLEGSFQLNKAESDKAARATEKFLAGLTTEQRTKLTSTFAMQLIQPRSFAVIDSTLLSPAVGSIGRQTNTSGRSNETARLP